MTALRDYAAAQSQPALGDEGERGRYDEVVGPDGSLRPAWKGLAELAVGLTTGRPAPARRRHRPLPRRRRRHLRAARAGPGRVAARPGAAGHRRAVLDAAGDRPGPARRAAQRAPRRPVRRAAAARRRASCRPRSSSGTPASPGSLPGPRRSTRARSCWPPPTWAATPPASGGCSADRAQAPSGIGYAMENRRVISRVLPELYREAGLHRMEPYFWALRSALIQSAQGDLADPRVVVLSPGTHSETAYDQAFVAVRARLPARAGQRPGRARRLGAPQGARGPGERCRRRAPGAGRRDPAPRRRRLERPARAARRLAARGRRPRRGGAPRPGARRQRPRRRRPGEPRAAALPARPRARRCSASRCGWRRSRPGGAATRTRSATCSTTSTRSPCAPSTGRPPRSPASTAPTLRERLLAAPHRYVGQERLPLSQSPTWTPAGPAAAGAHAAHLHAALRLGVPPPGRRPRQRARRRRATPGRGAATCGCSRTPPATRTRAWPTCCR